MKLPYLVSAQFLYDSSRLFSAWRPLLGEVLGNLLWQRSVLDFFSCVSCVCTQPLLQNIALFQFLLMFVSYSCCCPELLPILGFSCFQSHQMFLFLLRLPPKPKSWRSCDYRQLPTLICVLTSIPTPFRNYSPKSLVLLSWESWQIQQLVVRKVTSPGSGEFSADFVS